jgi:crotonobetainyl-CoA:carnitine CoA-transferase CaiB-like acyl-CoA transferase
VIAGPVCTRFLGALGADVLRIDSPRLPDMAPGVTADTLFGKRSAGLDLDRADDLATLERLLDGADVVVTGYRPGALEKFGLGAAQLAGRHNALVIVCLDAWGHTGPWAGRRGFDSVVQAATGIADIESADGATPGALPCQLLDHGTGYLAAAAALDGLRRQMSHGGARVRRLSLARTAAWLTATRPPVPQTISQSTDEPRIAQFDTLDGDVQAVEPPGSLAGQPLRWARPPARYLSDPPSWRGA